MFTPKQLLYSTTTKKESIYEKRMALTGEDPHVGLFVCLIPLLCSLRPFFLKKQPWESQMDIVMQRLLWSKCRRYEKTTRPRLKRSRRNPFKNNLKWNRGALHIDAGCCSTVGTSLCCAVGSRLALICYVIFSWIPSCIWVFRIVQSRRRKCLLFRHHSNLLPTLEGHGYNFALCSDGNA